MGVVTYEMEVATSLPLAKIFSAIVDDGYNIVPKALPHAIKSVEIIEGDGGVGSIRQINFGEATPIKYVKEQVDAIDRENFTYTYTVIEGDALAGKMEKICTEVKFLGSPDGGSIVKGFYKCYTVEGYELKEEDIEARKKMSMGLFKAVEAYVLANP